MVDTMKEALTSDQCAECGSRMPQLTIHARYFCCSGWECGCGGEMIDHDLCSSECHEQRHTRRARESELVSCPVCDGEQTETLCGCCDGDGKVTKAIADDYWPLSPEECL